MSRTTPGVQSGYRPFELRAYAVPADARIVGLSVAQAEARFPEARIFVLRLRRDGEIREVEPDLRIEAGDILAVGGRRAPHHSDPRSQRRRGGGPGAPRQPLPHRRDPGDRRLRLVGTEPAVPGRHALGARHLPEFPPPRRADSPARRRPGHRARRRPEAHRSAGHGRARRDADRPADRADHRDRFHRARLRHLPRRARRRPAALQHRRDRGRDRHQRRRARRRADRRPPAHPPPALRPHPGRRRRADDLARPRRLRGDDRPPRRPGLRPGPEGRRPRPPRSAASW